jgi:hypothetical protein
MLGLTLGLTEGDAEGLTLGLTLGEALGLRLGDTEGDFDGDTEGDLLGDAEGLRLGLAETSDCRKAHWPQVVSATPSRPVIATSPVAPGEAKVRDATQKLTFTLVRLATLVSQDPPGMVVVAS